MCAQCLQLPIGDIVTETAGEDLVMKCSHILQLTGYERKPERFFCRNCVIYIDNPVVADKHAMVTTHTVDQVFP